MSLISVLPLAARIRSIPKALVAQVALVSIKKIRGENIIYMLCKLSECNFNFLFADDEPATTTTTQTIATDATTSQTSTTDDTVLECMYNDITLREGERYCPAPNQTVICQAGRLEYSSHCAPLTCADPIQGRHACDCPFCAGTFVVYTHTTQSLKSALYIEHVYNSVCFLLCKSVCH